MLKFGSVAVLLLLLTHRVEAARYTCRRPLTLAESIDEADSVAFGSLLATAAKPDGDGSLGRYRVLHVAKSPTGIAAGQEVAIQFCGSREVGEQALLASVVTDGRNVWHSPLAVSRECYDYAIAAPAPDSEDARRVRYLLQQLDSRDETITADALYDLSLSPLAHILAAKELIPRNFVRARFQGETTKPSDIGFYGTLLGLCGDDSDRELLRRLITPAAREGESFRFGVGGLILGYLFLAGEEGLDWIDEAKLKNRDAPLAEAYAALWAVRSMWDYGEGRFSRERLRQSVEYLLDVPDLSDPAITTLTNWEDWSQHDRFLTISENPAYSAQCIKTSIATYMLASTRVSPEIQAHNLAGFRKAETAVRDFRLTDPQAFRRAQLHLAAERRTCVAVADPADDPESKQRREQTKKRLKDLAAVVFESKGFVVEVNANRTGITDDDLKGVADFHKLADLSLEETEITAAGISHLVDLKGLVWLNLYRTEISDDGLQHIAKIKRLQFLPIGETKITDKGLAHLKDMTQLAYLGLRGNRISDRGVEHLSGLTGLTGLYLGETDVTDAGLGFLKKMTRLEKLWLNDTAITDKSVPLLAELKSLRELHVERSKMSAAGVAALRRKLPACEILYGDSAVRQSKR